MALNRYNIENFYLTANSSFNGKSVGEYVVHRIMRNPFGTGSAAYLAIMRHKLTGQLVAISYENLINFFRPGGKQDLASVKRTMLGSIPVVQNESGNFSYNNQSIATPAKTKELPTIGELLRETIANNKADNIVAPTTKVEPRVGITLNGGRPSDSTDGDIILSLQEVMHALAKLAANDVRAANFIKASVALL